VTLPLPLPELPDVTVIQLALLVAVQPQPLVVVTVSLMGPPAPVMVGLVGVTAKPHEEAACVTVTVWPAMVIVPVRDAVFGFAATV
jgi:hypothetical protein